MPCLHPGTEKVLDITKRDYFFENVSFFDSAFKVFEMQEAYDSYAFYLQTHGMIPKATLNFRPKLHDEVEEALQAGESLIFADIMFIVEEPAGVSPWPWQGRTPSFFRLVWDSERAMWRHVEAYFSVAACRRTFCSTSYNPTLPLTLKKEASPC